jgi:hypothetical protein
MLIIEHVYLRPTTAFKLEYEEWGRKGEERVLRQHELQGVAEVSENGKEKRDAHRLKELYPPLRPPSLKRSRSYSSLVRRYAIPMTSGSFSLRRRRILEKGGS